MVPWVTQMITRLLYIPSIYVHLLQHHVFLCKRLTAASGSLRRGHNWQLHRWHARHLWDSGLGEVQESFGLHSSAALTQTSTKQFNGAAKIFCCSLVIIICPCEVAMALGHILSSCQWQARSQCSVYQCGLYSLILSYSVESC